MPEIPQTAYPAYTLLLHALAFLLWRIASDASATEALSKPTKLLLQLQCLGVVSAHFHYRCVPIPSMLCAARPISLVRCIFENASAQVP
jgi:hypothetical protein